MENLVFGMNGWLAFSDVLVVYNHLIIETGQRTLLLSTNDIYE